MTYVKNSRTGTMHMAYDGAAFLYCGRPFPLSCEMSSTVYGIHRWCDTCYVCHVANRPR